MHVLDFLPGVGAYVCKQPVATIGDPRLPGDPNDEAEEVVPLAVLPQVEVVQRRQMCPRNDEDMLGSLRLDVAKSDESLVFQQGYPGRNPPSAILQNMQSSMGRGDTTNEAALRRVTTDHAGNPGNRGALLAHKTPIAPADARLRTGRQQTVTRSAPRSARLGSRPGRGAVNPTNRIAAQRGQTGVGMAHGV